jgi:SpoVK/Ycf46/Vps4 family AAA+-type ATPase
MPVDLSRSYYKQYQQGLREAERYITEGRTKDAAAAYRQCAVLMRRYAESALDASVRERRLARAESLAQKAKLMDLGQLPRVAAKEPASEKETDYEKAAASLIYRSSVTWDDIAGLQRTKREVKTAYALTMARKPSGIQVETPGSLLLYGPPGTGKTLLAAATSNGLDATFFNVQVSDALSKYFGESSKLIRALYDEARQRAPSVIFLDEVDAISRARGESGESGAERRLLSTFLSQLDGLNTKDDPAFVLTIAATNRPWDLDSAVRSRFAREVYVPLPDATARRRILEIHLEEKGHQVEVSYDDLVVRTDGYSGREIAQMCEQAVAHMVQCANPSLESVVDRGREAVTAYELQVEALSMEDFEAAFKSIGPPETTAEDLDKFERWREEGD